MSGAKPRSAWPTTSRITVKEKILPLPLTCTHSSLSLAQSPQTGRGQKIHVPQFWHFCIMSLPALAPSQKGWLTGVTSGNGFLIALFSSAIIASYLSSFVKIRNPKHEIRNKFEIGNGQNPKLNSSPSRVCLEHWSFLSFEIVSNFGFRVSSLAFSLDFASQDGCSGAAEILTVVHGADAGRNTELDIGDLALAGFTADLAHGFDHVQHAARRRRLAAIDHAAARLNRQITFECEVGLFKECFVVSTTEAEIFDLDHHDRDVIVVEIETANVLARHACHVESPFAGLGDARNQRVGAIARPEARVVTLAPPQEIHRRLAHALGAFRGSQNVCLAAVGRHHAVEKPDWIRNQPGLFVIFDGDRL